MTGHRRPEESHKAIAATYAVWSAAISIDAPPTVLSRIGSVDILDTSVQKAAETALS